MSTPQQSLLLSTPLEIRLKIYRCCFPPKPLSAILCRSKTGHVTLKRVENRLLTTWRRDKGDNNKVSWKADSPFRVLFLVCKQVREEALDVLYGENTFQILNGLGRMEDFDGHLIPYVAPENATPEVDQDEYPVKYVSETELGRMRKIMFVAFEGRKYVELNTKFWGPFLGQLSKIQILVSTKLLREPEEQLSMEMATWLQWWQHVLRVFATYLREDCIIEIDLDKGSTMGRTEGSIDLFLDERYQLVRTKEGDSRFGRGFEGEDGL